MNYEDINEIIISGIINNITDTNDKYIKFSIVAKKNTMLENKNVYVSLNISRELYNTYQDYFIKGSKAFIKGYLNSYIDKNKTIKSFITVSDISNNSNEIKDRRPYIRIDPDGVEVWNGKRCEAIPPTEEEKRKLEELLKEYK